MSDEICPLQNLALTDPLGQRLNPSGQPGITMILDKGLGIRQFQDLLETAGDYIDFVKLGFGTTALYPTEILRQKLALAKQFNVDIYPGGTFFEVAFNKGKAKEYLQTIQKMGFSKVEISDGTIELNRKTRLDMIKLAKDMGFTVITEYGKKTAGSTVDLDDLKATIHGDRNAGASYVIVEGRESGEAVGIYDQNGHIQDNFPLIVQEMKAYEKALIWETPKKNQQVEMINWFGPNVNLGNIAPEEVFSLESLRRGLRSDTFFLSAGSEKP